MADSVIRRGRDTHVSSSNPDHPRAQAKHPLVTSTSRYIYLHLPLPGVRNRTIESAILSVPVKDAWAAQTLTATPVAEAWGPRKTTWNNQPALRGEITTRRVYRYADGGEEFLHMVSGTQHPQGQVAACPCDSGKTYLDCHLAERYADGHTCDCGSGEPFRDCCMVSNGVTVSPS